MDILEETGLLNSKPVDTPMDPNVKLQQDIGDWLENSIISQSLVQTFPLQLVC